MAKFEENLDAKISEVLSEAKLSDEMYQKYMQFVGALDALPQDQISTDRFTSDIHDQFGRVRPMSSWPTKTSRAKSEKVWLNYNQRLQLAQAAKEGGTAPEDPTDDPDFLGQLLDTCVRTSMSMGKLDKQTAFRHCSRQVKRFETGIRTALADRGLTKAQVEEFTQQLLRGMANGKQIDMKDLSVEDRQFIQDLKDSLTYKAKNEGLIREDLDDKDEFGGDCLNCYYATSDADRHNISLDVHRYHAAHVEADQKSNQVHNELSKALQNNTISHDDYMGLLSSKQSQQAYDGVMAKHGFTKNKLAMWHDQAVKEDLDDKDEFDPKFTEDGIDAFLIEYWGRSALSNVLISTAKDAMAPGFELLDSWGQLDFVKENFRDVYDEVAAEAVAQLNESVIRENLEDKDEFARDCNYFNCDNRPDRQRFHAAHEAAFDAAKSRPAVGKFSDALQSEMAKLGYYLVDTGKSVEYGYPWDTRDWTLKESLEDSDEFEQCEYADCAIRHAHGDPKFHDAHTKAAAFADGVYAKDRNWSEFIRNFAAIMGRYGYSKDSSGKWGKISLGGGIKEDAHMVGCYGYQMGDWLEIGPKHQPQIPTAGLDDTDEFGGENQDWPTTPVQIQVIFPSTIFLSNHELLALPDKSGVRWHARPKWAEPKWFEQWSSRVSVWEFEKWVDEGLVRKIDNIQKWFHAQPEK